MMNKKYMRYADEIEGYLENRPRAMVKHCLIKKSLGENLDTTGIKMIDMGRFIISYYDDGQRKEYYVEFGDDENMPSCTCPSWRSSAFPCKHFFAIFKAIPSWNWFALSSLYRNSPYFTLDSDVNVPVDEANVTVLLYLH